MAPMVSGAVIDGHPERLRMPAKLAKLGFDSPKNLRKLEEWRRDAEDCRLAIRLARMDDKEAAADLELPPSQLSDMLAARERPQTERWRSSDRLRGPYLVAQAMRHPELFDVVTTISVRSK